MSDPEHLLSGPLPSDVASLLRSADDDVPPAAAEKQRRICAAIATSSALPPSTRTREREPARTLRNAAWAGLSIAILAVGAFGVHAMSAGSPASPSPQPSPIAASPASPEQDVTESAPPPAPAKPRADDPVAMPSVRVDELPSAAASAELARPSSSGTHALRGREGAPASAEDELKMIDAARGALASGEPSIALSHVHRYRATFQAPRFVDEADALEVQALAALGRTDEAQAKAKAFASAHPNSPYTQRVRSAAGLRAGGN